MHRIPTLILAFLMFALFAVQADAAKARHHPKRQPREHAVQTTVVTAVEVAQEGSLRSAWVQYGPGGALEARAVVEGGACPAIFVDLHDLAMERRASADAKFPTLCTAVLPAGTKQAAIVFPLNRVPPPRADAGEAAWDSWGKEEFGLSRPGPKSSGFEWLEWSNALRAKARFDIIPLALPAPDPQRILVLGDTGCRIKGKALQDCSDPEKWPFPQIAAEAAKLKPDLVIHVGDYLYRENACPTGFAGCAGTPFGDNWPTWDADFFAPAAPLLATAPWVFVRGNHEDCDRAGPGWLRLLGPLPVDASCAAHLAPYSIPLDAMNLVVMDNADAPETSITPDMVPVYRQEFASLATAKAPTWLLLHRPVWAAISGPLGIPIGGNQTLIESIGTSGIPSPVALMLAGHIHTFEAINYANHVPAQVVAGFSGDALDSTPSDLKGTVFQGHSGVTVKDGLSLPGFGFLLMTKATDGWQIDVYDVHGRIERQCQFASGRVDCPNGR